MENDETIDEVMVSVMRAPKTFTREDVVEINTHGGVAVTNEILNSLSVLVLVWPNLENLPNVPS